MDIELEKLKKLEEALSDCVDILRDCQVDKTCDNCKHSDLPRGYEPCVYCRNKDDWEPKESPCPCEDGIDSKACVGCEHSEDGKKKYRPYESSVEMIVDFIDRFNVNCLSYCKPLIWVRLKVDKRERLIVAYGDNFVEIGNKTKAVTLQHLFEQYEFLDGSPVGMEVKE